MKLNWGTGVAAVFIFFVTAVLVVVGVAVSTRVDLVGDRYYEKGVRYQERINALERTASLEERLLVRNAQGSIVIQFPRRNSAGFTGSVYFYRPADRSRDVSFPVSPDSAGIQRVDTGSLDRGLWKVQVLWSEGPEEFYAERSVMLY